MAEGTQRTRTLIAQICESARALEGERVLALCERLLAELHAGPRALSEADVNYLLGTLRAWQLFDAVQFVADSLIRLGHNGVAVFRQYAQALIDRGRLIPALEMLENLRARTGWQDEREYAEVCGLIGRVYKQIHIDAAGADRGMARDALERAIESYGRIYRQQPSYIWHGVNVAALVQMAMREGIQIAGAPDPIMTARDIIATIETLVLKDVTPWDYATAAEAALVLGEWDGAESWLRRYVQHPNVDAFALAGTLRQFTQIWAFAHDSGGHDRQGRGEQMVAALRAALLERRFGAFDLTPKAILNTSAAADEDVFERILGVDGPTTCAWLQKGIDRAKSVAMVRRPDGGGHGTGFLIRGGDLYDPWGEEIMLLTNAHVVSDGSDERGALRSDEAQVTFELRDAAAGDRRSHSVEILWNSPSRFLDASVLRLNPPIDLKPCPVMDHLPVIDQGDAQRVYVIGHPAGRELSFSLQDNDLLDYERPPADPSIAGRCLLHYRTPTEPGSSGSPVFERMNWRVIGLHHAGGEHMRRLNGQHGTYAANEGIWIQSIKRQIEATSAGADDTGT